MRSCALPLALSLLAACPAPSRPEGTDTGVDDVPCNVNSDCPAKHYCGNGTCAFDCRRDDDCPVGNACNFLGKCETVPDAGGGLDAGPNCPEQPCEPGAVECLGDSARACATDGAGCGVWASWRACAAGETCGVHGCEPVPCATGERRCGPQGVERCGDSGVFVGERTCAQGCAEGECVGQVSCEPFARRCVSLGGASVQQSCGEDGRAWLFEKRCGAGCSAAGTCDGPCTEGESQCEGDRRRSCVGGAFETQELCARGCRAGRCLLTDLEVAGGDVRLSGLVEVDGDVRIVSGGRVLVEGADGLTLRAKSISIDATGSIVARATGATVAGAGRNGTVCSSATTVVSGGGGGGYGVKGLDSERVATSCFPRGAGGAAFGGDKDAQVSAGGPGGKGAGGAEARGGSGGVVVRLLAPVVELDGEVRADGERGANGEAVGGGGGGGSGGGLLVAANVLRVRATAVLSAKGGLGGTGGYIGSAGAGSANGGDGGDGRVKLLGGTERTVAGTVTGVKTEALLAPAMLVSSTHPEEDAWFNDGGAGIDVAWSLPFPGVSGFLWNFTQTDGQTPTASNGRFVGPPSLWLPLPDRGGAWFLYVASIDAQSRLGTVAAKRTFRINAAPPAVASQSHPKNVFTNRPDAFFSWTDPQEGANWPRYRWVLDRFGNTSPLVANAAETADKDLVLPGLANGLWVLHVVALDRNGDPTRVATHYRFGVGTTPTRGTLSGTVRSASSGAVVSGAALSLNDGLEAGTSLSNGTYRLTPYPGRWSLRVSKDGFRPATFEVDVAASQTTTLDVSLEPAP